MRRAPSTLLGAIALFACAHGPPGLRAADDRSVRRLERLARGQLDCPDVRVGALSDVVYRAQGCGRLGEFSHVCTGRRCHWDAIVPVVARASSELACPIEILEERVVEPGMHEVVGCGHAGVYRIVCRDTICEWVGEPPSAAVPAVLALDTTLEIAIPAPPGGSTDDLLIPAPPAGPGR